MKRLPLVIFFTIVILFSCKQPHKETTIESDIIRTFDTTTIEYSQHFSIEYKNDLKLVHIYKDDHRKDTLNTFVLIRHNASIPDEYKHAEIIRVPLKKIACLSTIYVSYLSQLQLLDRLCAVDNSQYIYDKTIKEALVKNKVSEIGSNNSINFEKLAALSPDVVFTYWEQGLSGSAKLNELNIKPVLVIDHLETSPLGRAEWIKLMAALFNEEKNANDFFNELKANYLRLSKLKDTVQTKPSVLVGTKLSDAWYVPGGKSYMAQLINDAGGNYLWNNDSATGSLPLTFENVLKQAQHADVWLNVYQWKKMDDVVLDDKRYSYFDAYNNKNIINNNARVNEFGGNDFWGSGLLQPDLVLSDLIKIFHPELLPDYQLKYYKKLE